MAITFDGDTREIILDPLQLNYTDSEIYSRWSEWVHSGDGAVYPAAFEQEGSVLLPSGDLSPSYTIIQNQDGWRIRIPATNSDYTIDGNLIPKDANQALSIKPTGFNPNMQINRRDVAIINAGLPVDQTAQLNDVHAAVALTEFLYKIHARKRDNDGTTTRYYGQDGTAVEFEFDDNGQLINPKFVPLI